MVSSIWRNNRAGLVPASLDLELRPPQRETVIAGNLIVGNSNRRRPRRRCSGTRVRQWSPDRRRGRQHRRANVIADHEQYGVLVTPMFDRNFWPAQEEHHSRTIRSVRSGRADLAARRAVEPRQLLERQPADRGAPAVCRRSTVRWSPPPLGFDPWRSPRLFWFADSLSGVASSPIGRRSQPRLSLTHACVDAANRPGASGLQGV